VTASGTLGIFNGSDTFRGLFLDYTNANHTGTGNTVALLDIDAITGGFNFQNAWTSGFIVSEAIF
jgi:hypothetical protein